MNTAFHRCLAELDAAEDAWFNDEGNGKYVEWAHNYTALVRGLLQMTCKDIDAGAAYKERKNRSAEEGEA